MTGTAEEPGQGTADGWRSTTEELQSLPVPWGVVLATGIFGVVFGAAVLIWPDISLRVMALIAGGWLLMAGLARIIAAFLPGSGGSIVHHLLSGIVGVVVLIAGLVCLRDLVSRLTVLALLFAVTWILSGITGVVLGLQQTGPARAGLIAAGLLSVAAGIVFVLVPDLSLTTLVVLTGVSSLLVGLSEVVLALFLRRTAASTRAAGPGLNASPAAGRGTAATTRPA
ncbi:HdeD family acid-resistance protein [Jidongwangia harbinensis]|uniref:HdeD family acid-resistance protein n=1 Tax=Jidongwangia harbinensis TaxID=2878561 RepID=UPI001CD9260C|nr:DUF308 domain-containing protein [Jidongwangia harbinensis]MCA2211455.1 DUF308 domain-containing protein [Jidongwangia harbinensis]